LDLRVAEASQTATSLVQLPSASGRRSDTSTSLPTDAIREELAAAQYIGARLLREEGRPPEVWRPVANEARQHYRYLSASEGNANFDARSSADAKSSVHAKSSADTIASANTATNEEAPMTEPTNAPSSNAKSPNSPAALNRDQRLQRNLEQVLNLEQSTSDQLEGLPLPRRAPLARRPGDGEPGNRPGKGPGRGPLRDGPPSDGGGIPGPYGVGW
jgi:hypothetical protein